MSSPSSYANIRITQAKGFVNKVFRKFLVSFWEEFTDPGAILQINLIYVKL
jgi:hypothetical protein